MVDHFQKQYKPISKRKRKPLMVKAKGMRRPLPMRFKYLIVFLRYGSLDRFDELYLTRMQIAKRLHCTYATVDMFLKRFVERGHVVLPDQRRYKAGRPPHIFTPELRAYLLSPTTLDKWAGFTLLKRCALIQ